MVSERTVADLQRRLLAAQSEAVNERDKRRNQVAERDRRIAELEGVLRRVQDRLQHREDIREVCYDSCPRCAVDAALAGKGVSR